MQTVAQYVMRALKESGVEVLFGYPGRSNLLLLEAACATGIRYVRMADERSAGFAAIGYIDATGGKPSAACACSGPGTTNLLTPLLSAKVDGLPLLAITGNVADADMRRRGFQEFHPCEAFVAGAAVKAARFATAAAQIPDILQELFCAGWTQPQGPVLLDIPSHLLAAPLPPTPYRLIPPVVNPHSMDEKAQARIREVAQLIKESNRPLFLVGRGARADFRLVRFCAARLDVPVVHTMGGCGVVASDDPLYGGLLRHNGDRSAAYLVQHADVVVALGTGMDRHATGDPKYFAPRASIVHVDIDTGVPARAGLATLPVHALVGTFLRALLRLLPDELRHERLRQELAAWQAEPPVGVVEEQSIAAREVVAAVADVMGECVVVKDSGAHKYWVTKYAPCLVPRRSVASCHLGSMGFGLPAAIGASIGCPDETVMCVGGDGGFMMTLADIPTAVHQRCSNLKILIFNNGGLGSTRDYERRVCRTSTSISDFGGHLPVVSYARGLGVESHLVSDRAELAALGARMRAPGLVLFDCVIDRTESMTAVIPYGEPIGQLSSEGSPPTPQTNKHVGPA